MKTNGKHEVIAGIAGQSLVLAALLAMVLSAVGITHAQSSAIPAAAPAAKLAAAPAKASALPAAKPAAKGQQQGITVSGHWVIEVRNPDGKVTAHTEFENAIQPTGMVYLAALLAGNNAPGQLSIMLNGAGSNFCNSTYFSVCDQINFYTVFGPCGSFQSVSPPTIAGIGVVFYAVGSGGPCIITAAANKSSYTSFLGAACLYYSEAGVPYCSTNLTTTAPTVSPSNYGGGLSATSLTLGGTVVASYPPSPYTLYITDVETIFETCTSGSTTSGCAGSWDLSKTGSKAKSGVSWAGMNLFTQATLPSPGIAYISGQTLSATVTFTFSSPSS